jgi:hypothetical protein
MPSTVATYQQGAPAQRVIAVAISSIGTRRKVSAAQQLRQLWVGQETRKRLILRPGLTHLYEHPACQAPHTPLFLFFLPVPRFSCSTAPQGFSRPDRVLSQAGARRVCQGWPLFSGPPSGLGLYTTEHDGRLDGSGRLHSYLALVYVSAGGVIVFRSRMLFFGKVLLRGPWRVR